jgi:CRISPR-associated protein Cas4
MDTDEDLYHATPQTRGKIAHASLDAKNYSTRKDVLTALPVYSSELGIMGNSLYKAEERILIERKLEMKQISRSIYQFGENIFA